MYAKACKPLTSFQPASLHLVWDPIFGFKCMMYDALYFLPIPATLGMLGRGMMYDAYDA